MLYVLLVHRPETIGGLSHPFEPIEVLGVYEHSHEAEAAVDHWRKSDMSSPKWKYAIISTNQGSAMPKLQISRPSVASDIERIDKALSSYEKDDDGPATVDAELAMDALHDARSGLIYMDDLLKEAKNNE